MLSHARPKTPANRTPAASLRRRAAHASQVSGVSPQLPSLHAQDRPRPPVPSNPATQDDDGCNVETFKGLRTLIVEDDAVDQKIITAVARQLKLRPTVTPTAMEALELLKQVDQNDPFELMLIDYKMPTLDGLAASNLIKNQLNINTVPKIVLLSAYQKNEIFSSAADRDFIDSFATKPITASGLSNILQDFYRSAKTHGEQWPAGADEKVELDDDILARTHVLLAEDNYINQRVATGMLKQKSIQVTIANNGREAIDKIFGSPPGTYDVVLMDMDMPEVDGYGATETILQNPHYKNIPIIALTAHVSPEDKQRCFMAGMVEYLTKPIKPDVLYEAIKNHL